eukprot:56796-Eustigmatos_ZCMA.PRE.1
MEGAGARGHHSRRQSPAFLPPDSIRGVEVHAAGKASEESRDGAGPWRVRACWCFTQGSLPLPACLAREVGLVHSASGASSLDHV